MTTPRPLHLVHLACLLAAFAAAARAQDPLTRQALQRIERCEQAEAKLTAGDSRGVQACLADLDWAHKRLQAVYDKTEAGYVAALERYRAVRTKVEAKRGGGKPEAPALDVAALQQLQKDVAAAAHNFRIVPAKLWQDDARRTGMQRDLERLARRLAAFPADAGEVKPVAADFAALQQAFANATGKVADDRGAAEALQQQVAELRARYVAANLPRAPEAPFTADAVRAFLVQMQDLRERQLPADRVIADAAAGNGAVDSQQVESLRHTLHSDWPRRLDELARQVGAGVEGAVAEGLRRAEWLLATDATDRDQITNRVLARGAFAEQMAALRAAAEAVAVAKVHAELGNPADLGQPIDAVAAEAKVTAAIAHLQALAVTALDAVRMPAAATTDAELLRIAAETLRKPEYGVGEWLRLVANTTQVRRSRREGWLRPGTVAATLTVHDYVWDEFQVTTAERNGDDVWLFCNTLKYFHSGDPTTPVGRWILSRRFESTRILPQNVER